MAKTSDDIFEYFDLRPVYRLSATNQIIILTVLYVLTVVGYFFMVKRTGRMDGYGPSVSLLFVPIYEELLFRGLLLNYFRRHYRVVSAIIAVSVLFGLWHLKNIFWLDHQTLLRQIIYTTFFFSPLVCWLTLKTRNVWIAVMIHYLNNFPWEGWRSLF